MADDEAFFSVLDGHGGTKVMEYCKEYLHDVEDSFI